MSVCLSCLRGFHGTCRGGVCSCGHSISETTSVITAETATDKDESDERESSLSESDGGSKTRRHKRDAALKDQQSTGRKRAAKLYPLDREAACEWANKPAAGGGIDIPGCGVRVNTTPGLQQARHHGPDYNTLNNDPGNVHRICHSCHNSWHLINDPTKDESYLKLYGIRAGGSNFKNSKVLSRDKES